MGDVRGDAIEKKIALLAREGVLVENGKVKGFVEKRFSFTRVS